jgi:hypothetical protein
MSTNADRVNKLIGTGPNKQIVSNRIDFSTSDFTSSCSLIPKLPNMHPDIAKQLFYFLINIVRTPYFVAT